MKKIMVIRDSDIKRALATTTRQYLVGRLSRAQELAHIEDDKIEIGITSYSEFAVEAPHYHTQAFEYHYMVSGMTEYLDTETGEVYTFRKGDVYVIPPGVCYAQRSKPGTTIVFVKSPPGNDKVNVEPNDNVQAWLREKIRTTRTDYSNAPNAPAPNSIKPAAAVAIINENDEILLLKRRDSDLWTMPGGTLEFGEDLMTCALREVKEETGYDVEISDIIGIYTNPKTVIAYSDGEVRQEFTIVYSGRIRGGSLRLDDESSGYRWIALENVSDLPLAQSQRRRLLNVLEYHRTGKRFLY